MASSFTLNSSSYEGRYLTLTCSQTKNIASNTSTISWTLTSKGGSVKYYSTGPTTVTINGTQVYYKARTAWSTETFPAAAGSTSGSLTVSHDSLGNKSISVSLSTAIYTSAVSSQSGTWTLDSIPRQANITAAPNFNDEANPTITYSNPAGNNVTSLQACISLDGSAADIAYRDISKTGTSYTFNLTEAERNVLRNATTTANSRTVKFYVKTVIGGNTFYSNVSKTLSIVNATPTLNPTVADSNTTVTAVTGNNAVMVRGLSNGHYVFNASALKGATIKSYKVTNGSKSATASSGTINAVDSGTFVFTITDSRGNTASKTLTKTFVDYIKPTINVDGFYMSVEGELEVDINGICYGGSLGSVANDVAISYCYAPEGSSSFTSWTKNGSSVTSNSYNRTIAISGLDYRTNYVLKLRIVDKFNTVSKQITVVCVPVFDWDDRDFNFNVPVKMNNETILRHNASANNLVLSSSGGHIYIRPQGTDNTTGEIRITPQGDIIIGGQSLKSLLGIS